MDKRWIVLKSELNIKFELTSSLDFLEVIVSFAVRSQSLSDPDIVQLHSMNTSVESFLLLFKILELTHWHSWTYKQVNGQVSYKQSH